MSILAKMDADERTIDELESALAKLEEENAALRRKVTALVERERDLAAKLDVADRLLMRFIDG